jgi:uracil-DNA glycosylase family 4
MGLGRKIGFCAPFQYPVCMHNDDNLRRQYLDALGVPVWERRALSVAPVADAPKQKIPASAPQGVARPAEVSPDWAALEEAVRSCTKCDLYSTRTQTVFGVGNRNAQWMFVGEAPGAEEDRQGEPFVGAAGKLLNAMLAALGLTREQVYIANVLKCRPPNNRDPQANEVEQCESHLIRQIELIQPKLIVALGRHAAHSLLKTDLALARLRGQPLSYQNIPLVVTYHPAYLLRTPSDKRKAWEDLRRARSIIAETGTA